MGVLQEMFSADARVDLGDGHFSDGVMIVKSDGMNKSLSLDTKTMSSSETANALFSRAMMLKELNATPDIADGDGDGMIYDGTPDERPVGMKKPPVAAPKGSGVKRKPLSADAQLRAPKPKQAPHPSNASKP